MQRDKISAARYRHGQLAAPKVTAVCATIRRFFTYTPPVVVFCYQQRLERLCQKPRKKKKKIIDDKQTSFFVCLSAAGAHKCDVLIRPIGTFQFHLSFVTVKVINFPRPANVLPACCYLFFRPKNDIFPVSPIFWPKNCIFFASNSTKSSNQIIITNLK